MVQNLPMDPGGYATPEAAARAGMDPRCEVLASVSEGDVGYVLMNGGTENYKYPYGIDVYRRNGRWHEGSSSNAFGWSLTSDPLNGPSLGTWSLWAEVPADVDLVRVVRGEEVREVPVQNGVFLTCWFHQDEASAFPVVNAMRRHGTWEEVAHGYLFDIFRGLLGHPSST